MATHQHPQVPGDVELIDLRTEVADAVERARLCEVFFLNVYKDAFPKLDQAEAPDIWLPLLNAEPPQPAPILHLIVARRRSGTEAVGTVVAGIVVEYFRRSRVALATYLAVAPQWRRQGLGARLLHKAIDKVTVDNGGIRPLMFAEVERPEAQKTEADRKLADARLSVIAALGGKRLDFAYIQPQLSAHQSAVTDLMLVLLASGNDAVSSVPTSTMKEFLEEFFWSLEQRESAELKHSIDSLPADSVPLKELRRYE